jgi:hypothetical protein
VTDGIAVGLTVDTFSTSNFQPCLRTIPWQVRLYDLRITNMDKTGVEKDDVG